MESYFGVAKDIGLSKEEIGAVESIVIAVMGGQVRAKFREARRQAQRSAPRTSETPESAG